jgi:hypothetical protein
MDHHVHTDHDHKHGDGCGHLKVQHKDHVDYLHDGHLHHEHDGHYDEHVIEVSTTNPEGCHSVSGCDGKHEGQPQIPHGDHVDYLVDGRLHHVHGDHCDDHGPVQVIK